MAFVLLSEAERLNAETFVFDKSKNDGKILCKYKVAEKWEEVPSPPESVWSLVYNVYMVWAGLDYYKADIIKGCLKHDDLNWQWNFEVNQAHDKVTFSKGEKIV